MFLSGISKGKSVFSHSLASRGLSTPSQPAVASPLSQDSYVGCDRSAPSSPLRGPCGCNGLTQTTEPKPVFYFIQLISSLDSVCSPDVPLPRGKAPSGSGDLDVDVFGGDVTWQPEPRDPASRLQRRLRARGRACFLSTRTLLTVSGVDGSPRKRSPGLSVAYALSSKSSLAPVC